MMNSPVRILNVLTTIEDGGMEMLVSNIYEGLVSEKRYEFFIGCLKEFEENFIIRKFRDLGCNIRSFGIDNKKKSIGNFFNLFLKLFVLARYIAHNKIDIVHSHDFFSAAFTRVSVLISTILFWHKPKRNYVTLHNIFFWLSGKHHLLNRILGVFTTKIVCVSRSVRDYSEEKDRIKSQKYQVIYNGIDENKFVPNTETGTMYRRKLGFSENDIIIGNIGTLSVRKGHKYLIEAFLALRNDYKSLKLTIFGGTRGHEEAVRNEVMELVCSDELSDRVLFFDATDEITQIYNTFDMFVMPSVSEGFSLAAIEALLMQRVCIFSDIGPFRELVEETDGGLLFLNKNSSSLEAVLREVLENLEKYKLRAEGSRERAIEKFSYRKMIGEYCKLYELSIN